MNVHGFPGLTVTAALSITVIYLKARPNVQGRPRTEITMQQLAIGEHLPLLKWNATGESQGNLATLPYSILSPVALISSRLVQWLSRVGKICPRRRRGLHSQEALGRRIKVRPDLLIPLNNCTQRWRHSDGAESALHL